MSLFISSLNSGSNGNCYYIGNQEEAVLVDGGISCRETEKRMKRLGLSLKKVKAIFVSHEHGDHIHGVPVLSRKHKIPVYMTDTTWKNGRVEVRSELSFKLETYKPIVIGGLSIVAIPKLHDACDPTSFIIQGGDVRIGVFTDLGKACEHTTTHFQKCHAAFLETNYDEEMLSNGSYPFMLKERIRGDQGHLSNVQALELFMAHRPSYMSHLFLSHLSADNNKPKIVKDMFTKVAGNTSIIVASRRKETPLYHIRDTSYRRPVGLPQVARQEQLQLF